MASHKSIWHNFTKFFSKSDYKKDIKLRYCITLAEKDSDDECNFKSSETEENGLRSTNVKRHQTCSIDLSDKTYRPINKQELSYIESTSPIPRTNSFNLDRDFPIKLLPITDFEEKDVLGEGAFGRAIKVEYLKNGSFFVMKEVVSHSKENEESLIREVSLLRSLKHDNILTCLGLVLKEKRICLITELMHGGSLQFRIQDLSQTITLNEKILYMKDIASGMNFLHQNSIMHRDLTSSNCLLRKNNRVVVSDFGLSKFLNMQNVTVGYLRPLHVQRCSSSEVINEAKKCTLNVPDSNIKLRNVLSVGDVSKIFDKRKISADESGIRMEETERRKSMNLRRKHTVVGNPFWMAPEMLAGESYNCIVDLYSFGIIGCEITARISADPEYLERNKKDMSLNFGNFILKNKDKELANCPEELIDIIRKCCKTNPDKRPTFNIVLSWLEDILFGLSNNLQLKVTYSNS